jgi:5-hydroxyisourate hydrolase-like protein (transthyretin family)
MDRPGSGALVLRGVRTSMVLALLLTVDALSTQGQSAQAATAMSGPYRVAGTVVNTVTGAPVQGAMVALLTVQDSHTFAATESGDDGRFAIEHLPAAKFQLTASKRGFCTSFYDEHEEYNSAIVTGEGQETGNLVFKLTPGAVLSGVVTADGGDPVQGATVMLFEKPRGHEPGAKIEQVDTALTDDTGGYEFPNLAAGDYLLAVKAVPWYAMNRIDSGAGSAPWQKPETQAEAALDVAYPITFFDSTTDENAATPIALAAASRQEVNINLHAEPAVHLRVEAPRKQDGTFAQPELRETIFGVDVAGDSAFMSRTENGMTEIGGLAPGNYQLTQGDPPRVMELNAAGSQQIDPGAGMPAFAVSGTLQGGPRTGAMLVTLEPADGAAGQSSLEAYANQGAFTFPAVPAGTWKLEIGGEEMRVESIAFGGQPQAGNRVTVQDRPLQIAVNLSGSTTPIEGFARKPVVPVGGSSPAGLKDGKGFAGAMVVLVPKDPAAMAELARRDQSDSDGSFALLNVAPGSYTVVAIEDGWDMDWANPTVIARYLPGGEAVTVKDETDKGPGKTIQLPEPVAVQER